MKSFIVVATLFGISALVDGASVITPDKSVWSSNVSMTELQSECMAKISRDEDLMYDIFTLKFNFLSIFIKLTQEIRTKDSLDSLDSMIDNICYRDLKKDELYSLTMKIARLCLNEIDTFTKEEKEMIKIKLERVFCSVYMKLAAIITFSPDCMSNEATMNEISKCAQEPVYMVQSFRDWFFANPERCRKQSKILDCVNQAIRGRCSSAISEKIESTLLESRSILGCESEPNSIDVHNTF